MKRRWLIVALLPLWPSLLFAQNAPIGEPVLNQGLQLRAITPSDTATFQPTRALFIGNATACNITVVAAGDNVVANAQTLNNVQPGEFLPLSVIMVKTTGTSCINTLALY